MIQNPHRASRFRATRLAGTVAAAALAGLQILACGADVPGGGEADKSLAASKGDSADSAPIVLVTLPPQRQIVERIAGDRVRIVVLVPPDADPHTFEPTIAQMRAVSEASMYLRVGHPGLEFEHFWLERLTGDREDLRIVDGARGLDLSNPDPHVWLSPRAVRSLANNYADALVQLLPEDEAGIRAGLKGFLADLDQLDRELKETLAPARGRPFLVFHAAWGWFAEDYGLEQIAIERGHIHPGTAHVAELIDRARAEGIHVVFVQPQVGAAQAQAFAREIDGTVARVDPLAADWFGNLREAARAIAASTTGREEGR